VSQKKRKSIAFEVDTIYITRSRSSVDVVTLHSGGTNNVELATTPTSLSGIRTAIGH
jgi:hypothetical protein